MFPKYPRFFLDFTNLFFRNDSFIQNAKSRKRLGIAGGEMGGGRRRWKRDDLNLIPDGVFVSLSLFIKLSLH